MIDYLFIIVAIYDGMNYFMDLYQNCYEYSFLVLLHQYSYFFVHT